MATLDGEATRSLAMAPLPHSRELAVDSSGRLSRPFYTWASTLDRNALVLSRLAYDIKSALDGLPDVLGSTDGTWAGIPAPAPSLSIRAQGGIRALPIADGVLLSLENVELAEGGTLQRFTVDGKGRVIEAAPAVLADLDDVAPDAPNEGDALVFDGGAWKPGNGLATLSAVTSEPLAAGDFVNFWQLDDLLRIRIRTARSDIAGRQAHGFVTVGALEGEEITVHLRGRKNGLIGGLTPGQPVFLGDDGSASPTPAGPFTQRLGIAISATTLLFDPSGPLHYVDLPRIDAEPGDVLRYDGTTWAPVPAEDVAPGVALPMVNGEAPPVLMCFDDGSLLYAQVE